MGVTGERHVHVYRAEPDLFLERTSRYIVVVYVQGRGRWFESSHPQVLCVNAMHRREGRVRDTEHHILIESTHTRVGSRTGRRVRTLLQRPVLR